MITQLKGRLIEKNPTSVVIDCNGVGYEVNISLNTFSQIKDEEAIMLYTHLQIREDAHILYGFFKPVERSIFRLLISVSGIGPNTARTMLSSMTPTQIKDAIFNQNLEAIKSVKGIGLKTAQRLLIDLKDKILKIIETEDQIELPKNNTIKDETLSALEVLGYSRKSSEKVVDNLIHGNPSITIEDLIKGALNKL